MSIRFSCSACRKVLKIEDSISEPKKVRCSGCGIVILITPDEDDPDTVVATIPKKREKRNDMPDSQKRKLLWAALAVSAVVVIAGLWYTFKGGVGPGNRASVYGEVSLDGIPMKDGTIKFVMKDDKGEVHSVGQIVRGKYEIRAKDGPGIGANRVEITGGPDETVGPKYNGPESTLTAQIGGGSNKQDFEVKAR